MVAIDLVLGPLLTFVVFKPKKPKLAFDLAAIAVMQMIGLPWSPPTIGFTAVLILTTFAFEHLLRIDDECT